MTSTTIRSATSAFDQNDHGKRVEIGHGSHRQARRPAAPLVPRGVRVAAAAAGVVLSTLLIGSVAIAFDNVNALIALADA